MLTQKASIGRKCDHGAIECAAVALDYSNYEICTALLRDLAENIDRRAGHFDGGNMVSAEQLTALRRASAYVGSKICPARIG